MKRIWAAIALLLISLGFSLSEFFLVNNNYDKYVKMIDNAQSYFSKKEYKSAYDMCKSADEAWNKSKKSLNAFLLHSDVEAISESMITLLENAKNKDEKEFIKTADKTKRQLLSLKESELPNLENIM